MINIYPANRLENLVLLLDRVMQAANHHSILNEEIILVHSKGMQHWLNLKLAENRGISMNLHFSLPMQFFWTQIRIILGKNNVPEKSAYSRDVLSWRIHELLATDTLINHPLCQEATRYWFKKTPNENKRFQLACQLADLFEQYLIFRPDWIEQWSNNKGQGNEPCDEWQGIIWQLLLEQDKQHPVYLLKKAIQALKRKHYHLPERISLFGINTLPPLWLEFLSELGEHTDVHFFHLNPCVEYWGDLKTDKAQAKEQFDRWLKSNDQPLTHSSDDVHSLVEITNPLLANLGIQGKDFLYLLQEQSSIEIPVYESPETLALERGEQVTVLQHIQDDILHLRDRSYAHSETIEPIIDNSITLVSAHSALREIQALHDWLLHQINHDPSVTPKDILVMCPNVENYAPYVDAVFAHGWYDWSEQIPPLPCSIADRTLKDSEPLVQAFIDLLELPDSRFQVSQIMAYLRLPALQNKFKFLEDDLILLERWVNHANIHWGLDETHKQQILSNNASQNKSQQGINNQFTWQYGLNRLLLGFAQGDNESIYQEQLLLADIEGDDALLLGRYFALLEQLKYYADELKTERTPDEWQQFLLQAKESLFSPLSEDNNAQEIIDQAIDDLSEYTHHADYTQKLPLTVIRDFLFNHFSQPEPGRQFMSGQVTFCSMIPMRSVPFRIIAVLGLNDGEFPRQRQHTGFDLMAMDTPRKGDRSLRGDDRYLFLEALISCREKLYLSYQGHDVKTNNQREASLVLQELIHYLENAYGWHITKNKQEQCYQVPLQAFNKENYTGQYKSFNTHWLKLSAAGEARNNLHKISPLNDEKMLIKAEQLIAFFKNPAKQFAQQQLGLYLEQNYSNELEDSEPFVVNHLDRYKLQDKILNEELSQSDNNMPELIKAFELSGTLPDTPVMKEELQEWQAQACHFSDYIKSQIEYEGDILSIESITMTLNAIELTAELPVINDQLLYWRLATPKGQDDIRLWIHHLMAQITLGHYHTQGIFRGAKDDLLKVSFEPLDSELAKTLLGELMTHWQEGMQEAVLLNAALGQKHCLIKKGKHNSLDDNAFAHFWNNNFDTQGLGTDPYVNWFWGDASECPQWEKQWQARIELIYQALYNYRKEEAITHTL